MNLKTITATIGEGAEFINHVCQSNLVTRTRGGRIFFSSRKPLAAGDELTLDYNIAGDGAELLCSCGTKKCRGTINQKA